jgi:transposase
MMGAARTTWWTPSNAATCWWPIGAYDSNALRQTLAACGARANVKPMPNRVIALPFNRRLYRKRNLVERFFNKIKHYRAVATRYDKRDDNFLAAIKLASIRIWLRFNESMT